MNCLLALKDYETALQIFEEIISAQVMVEPSITLYSGMGRLAVNLGDLVLASRYFEKGKNLVAELYPNHDGPVINTFNVAVLKLDSSVEVAKSTTNSAVASPVPPVVADLNPTIKRQQSRSSSHF